MGSDIIEAGNDLTDGQTAVAGYKKNCSLHYDIIDKLTGWHNQIAA